MSQFDQEDSSLFLESNQQADEHQDPRALAGLFADEISKRVSRQLGKELSGPSDPHFQQEDPLDVVGAYSQAAKETYHQHLRDYEITEKRFSQAVLELLNEQLEEVHLVPIATPKGREYVNKRFAKAAVGQQLQLDNERERKQRMRKIKQNRIKKLRKISKEKDQELAPDRGRLRVRRCSEQTVQELCSYLDTYAQQHGLNTPTKRGRHWLRALGGFLWKQDIKIKDQVNFHLLILEIQDYWQVDNEFLHHGKQVILARRADYKKLAFPRGAKYLSPAQLDDREFRLNKKYGPGFCKRKYYRVYHIMQQGDEEGLLGRELKEKLATRRQETEDEHPKSGEQLTFKEQYIHFPAKLAKKSSRTKVLFLQAVGYLFAMELDLHVAEREVLFQLFHRYNCYYRYIAPKPEKYHQQLQEQYRARKQREYDQKYTQSPRQPASLFTSDLYLSEDLVEIITHRIGW